MVLLFSILCSCNKDRLTGGFKSGNYDYAFTTSANSYADTTFLADTIGAIYQIDVSEFSETHASYAVTMYIDGSIKQHYVISRTEHWQDDNCNVSCLYKGSYTDKHGQGFETAGYYFNNSIYPPQDPFYMNIVDYPFPGWNRFILRNK
jgi:hypothetical protein